MSDIVQIEGTMTAINPLMTKDATTTIVANQITALGAMAPWDVANTYDAADQAEYLGIIYEANAAVSASEAIPTTNAKWFRVLKAYYGGIYDVLKAYSTYDSVAFTNSSNVYNIYQANQAIAIGESPETDAAKWDAYKVFGTASGTITEGNDSRVTGAQQTTGKDTTGGYAGLTLFKINFKNALDTFTSFFTNANTAARTYTFQDRDGTIADNTDLALKANIAAPSFTGTVTSAGLLDLSGASAGQIKFPTTQNASADANTFDDYEEGTFTPDLNFAGVNTGITGTQTGKYIKKGGEVTCVFHCFLTSKGTATGGLRVSALPFSNNASEYGTMSLRASLISYTGSIQAYVNLSSSFMTFEDITEAGTVTALDDTNVSDTSQIIVTLTYFV